MDGFLLAYDGFDPGIEELREALTSTGNGYLCTRGAAEWEDADGVHYPGTYAHGGYNRETTILGGLPVLNEDLVNLPNWLVLQLRIEGEDVIRLAGVELVSYRHELDIRNVTLIRQLRFRDGGGRETTLKSRRFASMADVHHAGIEWTLVPENWSGRVEVISALDGRVSNHGVARYRQLEGRHLNPVSPRTLGPEVIALKAETRQSNLYISEATRTRVFPGGQQLPVRRTLDQMEDYVQQVLAFDVHQGAATRVEKMVSFYTSRDPAGQRHSGESGHVGGQARPIRRLVRAQPRCCDRQAAGRQLRGRYMPIFQGAIFDVDGVLVDSPHETAWRESLRELMESDWRDIRGRTTWSPEAFTSRVYEQYMSGKPRMSGARAALDYFDVPDADQRVGEYAQRKQDMVVRLIEAGDFTAYPDALRFVIAVKDVGLLIADASSSKNATMLLSKIPLDTFAQQHGITSPTLRPGLSLLDYFDADLSGRDFAHGKPDPEIFLAAARELGVEPGHAVVLEDAPAGVQAAKAGSMAAIGIARADDTQLLAAAGADIVVTTLDDVDTGTLAAGRLAKRKT